MGFLEIVSHYWTMWLMASGMMLLGFKFRPEVMKIDKPIATKSILALFTLLPLIRLSILSMASSADPYLVSTTIDVVLGVPALLLPFVWLEDAAFVLPQLLLKKGWLSIILRGIIIAVFAMGHAYQGYTGIIMAGIFCGFLGPILSVRYGIFTFMAIHVALDVSGIGTAYLARFLGIG